MVYSVIIPTMWQVGSFPSFLSKLEAVDLIREIIIIDNAIKQRPKEVKETSKIKIIPQTSNIGVNPAWNLGANLAISNYLCILNDDIEFDLSVFSYLVNQIDSSCGMIGIDLKDKSNKLTLETLTERPFGFGCLFFMLKDNYQKIPSRLIYYYGDDWLFTISSLTKKTNKLLKGISPRGYVSATSHKINNNVATSLAEKSIYLTELKSFVALSNKND